MPFFEVFRPQRWSDVVGQDKAIAAIKRIGAHGFGGRAYWISGGSGQGKTTIARLIAAEVADPFCTDELDATSLTVADLNEIERLTHQFGFGIGGRAWIINEAHGLRKDVIRRLLTLLEAIPAHVVIVFTTTSDGEDQLFEDQIDAHPLLSRCYQIPLARRDLAVAFAERVREACATMGIEPEPIEFYVSLAKQTKNNMRAMFQIVEARGRRETVPA